MQPLPRFLFESARDGLACLFLIGVVGLGLVAMGA